VRSTSDVPLKPAQVLVDEAVKRGVSAGRALEMIELERWLRIDGNASRLPAPL
jgi:hypothetical protein